MDMQKLLRSYVLPAMVGGLLGIYVYVKGYETARDEAVARLYHPFEAKYLELTYGKREPIVDSRGRQTFLLHPPKCSAELDQPCPELIELQFEAADFQRMQAKLPLPEPDKEIRTLDRLTRLWNERQ